MVLNQECVRIAWKAFSEICWGFIDFCFYSADHRWDQGTCVFWKSFQNDSGIHPTMNSSRNFIGSKYSLACGKMHYLLKLSCIYFRLFAVTLFWLYPRLFLCFFFFLILSIGIPAIIFANVIHNFLFIIII